MRKIKIEYLLGDIFAGISAAAEEREVNQLQNKYNNEVPLETMEVQGAAYALIAQGQNISIPNAVDKYSIQTIRTNPYKENNFIQRSNEDNIILSALKKAIDTKTPSFLIENISSNHWAITGFL